MKIQLAIDIPSIGKALNLGMKVQDYIDFIEVGTPLIKKEGEKAIQVIRECFPKKTIVADMKTIDGGKYEAELAFEAGADITVVMGCADGITIKAAVEVALKRGKEVMIDLLGIRDLPKRMKTFTSLTDNIILLVHTAADRCQREKTIPFEELEIVHTLSSFPLAVAGGISLNTIQRIVNYHPSVVVIGSAITSAKDPIAIAKEFKRIATTAL